MRLAMFAFLALSSVVDAHAIAQKGNPMTNGEEWKKAEELVRQSFAAENSAVEEIAPMTTLPFHFKLVHGGQRDEVIVSDGHVLRYGKGGMDVFCSYSKAAHLLDQELTPSVMALVLRFFDVVAPGAPKNSGPIQFDERNPELNPVLKREGGGLQFIVNYNTTQNVGPTGGDIRGQDRDRLHIVRATLTVTPDYHCSWATERFEAKRGPEPKKKRKLWPFGE